MVCLRNISVDPVGSGVIEDNNNNNNNNNGKAHQILPTALFI
jgi:hypothetical protein